MSRAHRATPKNERIENNDARVNTKNSQVAVKAALLVGRIHCDDDLQKVRGNGHASVERAFVTKSVYVTIETQAEREK